MSTMRSASDDRMDRLGIGSGIVFAVLIIATFIAAPQPPKADTSIAKIMAYYADHRGGILAAAYLSGLAMVFFLVFLANLYPVLRHADGGAGRLALATIFGAIVFTGGIVSGTVFQTALAFRTGRDASDAPVVHALFDLQNLTFAVIGFPGAMLFVAIGLLVLRTAVLPVWLGWAALVVGAIQLLTTGAMLARTGIFASNDLIGLLGIASFILWFLVTSVVMLVRARTMPATEARVVPAP